MADIGWTSSSTDGLTIFSAIAGGGAVANPSVIDFTGQPLLSNIPPGSLILITLINSAVSAPTAVITTTPLLPTTLVTKSASPGNSSIEIHRIFFAAGGNLDISISSGALGRTTSAVYVITGQETLFAGIVAVPVINQGSPSISLTTTRLNSLIICATADINFIDNSTEVYRDSATELYAEASGVGFCTAYHYYKQATSIGLYTEGLTSPVGQNAATCAVEIRQ